MTQFVRWANAASVCRLCRPPTAKSARGTSRPRARAVLTASCSACARESQNTSRFDALVHPGDDDRGVLQRADVVKLDLGHR